MAGEVIVYLSDGNTPTLETRARSIARAVPAHDVFVYGGDVYNSGNASDWTGFDNAYGDTALSVTPNGQDLLDGAYETPGNHEYHTVNATSLRPTDTDNYWTTKTQAGWALDTTKADPNAVYSTPAFSGVPLTSAQSQKVAAAQWSHLNYKDIAGYRLLFIDGGYDLNLGGDDEGTFPTSGDYYDAVAALVNGASWRRLIVFCHFPRYSAGSIHGDTWGVNMASLWTLIAPKAMLLVSGHDHQYQRHQPRDATGSAVADQRDGCVGIVCGNGGAALASLAGGYTPALNASDATRFGFYKITLTDAYSVQGEFVHLGTDGLQTPTSTDVTTFQVADQRLRPDSDVTIGGWTGGATHYDKVNDDSDATFLTGVSS